MYLVERDVIFVRTKTIFTREKKICGYYRKKKINQSQEGNRKCGRQTRMEEVKLTFEESLILDILLYRNSISPRWLDIK